MVGSPPNEKWTPRPGLIVPFTYDGRIVGHTTRYLDDKNPRYIHDIQPGYVFGTDLQHADWQHVIVTEGVFDALSIAGLAVLHAEISDAQVRLIRSLGREITVVPDQDTAGMKLVDRAVELGWAVSMPAWPDTVKDVNDAVKQWGRLATLIHIMQSRETSRVKIELRKRQLAKKLR
jgi:DNA primase